jgi:hypothetical protein
MSSMSSGTGRGRAEAFGTHQPVLHEHTYGSVTKALDERAVRRPLWTLLANGRASATIDAAFRPFGLVSLVRGRIR